MSQLYFDMSGNKASIHVKYGSETVTFSSLYYIKGKDSNDVETAASPYNEFNQWITTKPQAWQSELFGYYKELRNTIDTVNNVELLLQQLNKIFVKVYDMISLEEIKMWIINPNTPVYVTTKPSTRYDENRIAVPKETTYEYEDYLELVIYSFALRLAAPVLGEVTYRRLREEYGRNAKEVYAMEMLHGTVLDDCRAEQRLKEFMANTKVQTDINNIVVSGLSEEDFQNYMYAIIVLKKVTLGDISGADGSYQLIKDIYYLYRSKIKQISKPSTTDPNQVQIKRNPITDNNSFSESNSQSILDVGYARSNLLSDDKIFLKMAINDHAQLINTLCSDLPPELYYESLDAMRTKFDLSIQSNEDGYSKPLQEVQLTILKWLVDESVNTVIFDSLELEEFIGLIAVIRAILWYREFYEFAAIISAISLEPRFDQIHIPYSHRDNITTAIQEMLEKRFDLAGNTKSEKRNMSAIGCIGLIETEISGTNWLLTLPDSWLVQNKIQTKEGRLIVQSNIRNRIAELMLFIEANQKLIEDI